MSCQNLRLSWIPVQLFLGTTCTYFYLGKLQFWNTQLYLWIWQTCLWGVSRTRLMQDYHLTIRLDCVAVGIFLKQSLNPKLPLGSFVEKICAIHKTMFCFETVWFKEWLSTSTILIFIWGLTKIEEIYHLTACTEAVPKYKYLCYEI